MIWGRKQRAHLGRVSLWALSNTQEKTVRLLYKNGFRMSRGLDDNFIEKGENETNRDFLKNGWNFLYWLCTMRVMDCLLMLLHYN